MLSCGNAQLNGTQKEAVTGIAQGGAAVLVWDMLVFTYDGVANGGQVPPNLMGSPSFDVHLQQCGDTMNRNGARGQW